MIFSIAAWSNRQKGFLISPILLFAVFFAFGVSTVAQDQTAFTRQQFSRLDVLSRAAYFEKEILQAAEAEGVDPNILWTIAYLETRFRPWLTSPKDARGLMQFIPSTAERFNLSDPYKSVPAIRAAAKYVKYLSNLFGGRVDSVLAAYNSGEGTVSAYSSGKTLRGGRKIINAKGQKTIGGVPPYSETIGYVGRGLKVYRWLIKRQTFDNANFRVNFPDKISASVANVPLFDAELGQVPNFIAPVTKQTVQNQIVTAENQIITIANNDKSQEIKPNETKSQEVFYDPRSGNRYIAGEKGKVKFNDGVVVISQDTRRTANVARSTFFSVPIVK